MMIELTRLALGASLVWLLFCGPAVAQMYRCGSTYQDRPCDAGQPSKTINVSNASTGEARVAADSGCTQRGKSSLKISWAREAGATSDKLLAEAKGADQKKLIEEVYQKRGSAAEVRAAIEADCMAEKERLAQAAALAAAAAKLAGSSATGPAPSPRPSETDAKAVDKQRQQEAAAREAPRKKSRCMEIDAEMENIRQRQRAGLSAGDMDRLNQRQRELAQSRSQAGCATDRDPQLSTTE